MPVELYGLAGSAPCRIVMMTGDMVDSPVNMNKIDMEKGEHKTPEFLAMNPVHNIPTIKDGDFCMNESRAIACYLVNKYKPDSDLLPKDPKTRAVVDQRMYFDMGTYYKAFGDAFYPMMFEGKKADDSKYERLQEVLGFVEGFAKGGKFIAGTDQLTLADICLTATTSTILATQPDLVPADKYPNLHAWFNKCKSGIKNYEKNDGEGAAEFGAYYKSKTG